MQSGRQDTLEERYAIKFCFKLRKNDAPEKYGMLQTAFGASCMNGTSVFVWRKRFKETRECVRDDERCGRIKEVSTPELIGQRVRVRVSFTMFRFETYLMIIVYILDATGITPHVLNCHMFWVR